jgi:hypothetical protein
MHASGELLALFQTMYGNVGNFSFASSFEGMLSLCQFVSLKTKKSNKNCRRCICLIIYTALTEDILYKPSWLVDRLSEPPVADIPVEFLLSRGSFCFQLHNLRRNCLSMACCNRLDSRQARRHYRFWYHRSIEHSTPYRQSYIPQRHKRPRTTVA